MKKNQITFIIIMALSLISIACFLWTRNDKIAYVDSARILQEYKGAIAARKELESKGLQWQANMDTLSADLQKSINIYEKGGRKDEAARQKIQEQQNSLNRYQQAIRQNASGEEARVTQEVVGKINNLMKAYGKDKGYRLILIASQTGTIAYAEEEMDITNDVLQYLNDQYQANKN